MEVHMARIIAAICSGIGILPFIGYITLISLGIIHRQPGGEPNGYEWVLFGLAFVSGLNLWDLVCKEHQIALMKTRGAIIEATMTTEQRRQQPTPSTKPTTTNA